MPSRCVDDCLVCIGYFVVFDSHEAVRGQAGEVLQDILKVMNILCSSQPDVRRASLSTHLDSRFREVVTWDPRKYHQYRFELC